MSSRRPRQPRTWSAQTKGTWSVGLGIAGLLIVACAVLALVMGYLARRDADAEGAPRAAGRGLLGMILGAVGLFTSIGWMAVVGGAL